MPLLSLLLIACKSISLAVYFCKNINPFLQTISKVELGVKKSPITIEVTLVTFIKSFIEVTIYSL